MKRISILFIYLLSVINVSAQWRNTDVVLQPFGEIKHASFLDENNFILNESGRTHITRDGGLTFKLLDSGCTYCSGSPVYYYAPDTFYMKTNRRNALSRSVDGGKTWPDLYLIGLNGDTLSLKSKSNITDIVFFDKQHGMIVGDTMMVFTTEDGGRSWQQLPPSALSGINF